MKKVFLITPGEGRMERHTVEYDTDGERLETIEEFYFSRGGWVNSNWVYVI